MTAPDQSSTSPVADPSDHIDLDRYLRRLGLPADTTLRPDLTTLGLLVGAHLRSIPFESLDPLTGVPVADLSGAALQRKLVDSARGGFCYEQNGLMRLVLSQIGFGVESLAARVIWQRPATPLPAETHQLLLVRMPGLDERYLVDVGFGGATPAAPLRFVVDDDQPTELETYRITESGAGYALTVFIGDRWQPVYLFTDVPRPPSDALMGSWFRSTHPQSPFVTSLTASFTVGDRRLNLNGARLAEHTAGRPSAISELGSVDEILAILTGAFGIDVSGIDGLSARIAAVTGL